MFVEKLTDNLFHGEFLDIDIDYGTLLEHLRQVSVTLARGTFSWTETGVWATTSPCNEKSRFAAS